MRKLMFLVCVMVAVGAFAAETRRAAEAGGDAPFPSIERAVATTAANSAHSASMGTVAVRRISANDYCDPVTYRQEADSVCRTMSGSRNGNGVLDDQWCRYDQYHRMCGEFSVLIIHDDGTEDSQSYCSTCVPNGDGGYGGSGGGGTTTCFSTTGFCSPACDRCTFLF